MRVNAGLIGSGQWVFESICNLNFTLTESIRLHSIEQNFYFVQSHVASRSGFPFALQVW